VQASASSPVSQCPFCCIQILGKPVHPRIFCFVNNLLYFIEGFFYQFKSIFNGLLFFISLNFLKKIVISVSVSCRFSVSMNAADHFFKENKPNLFASSLNMLADTAFDSALILIPKELLPESEDKERPTDTNSKALFRLGCQSGTYDFPDLLYLGSN
jgi:hypothetical protein